MTDPQLPEAVAVNGDPDLLLGQFEHDARTAIRDLIRVEGFEAAREFVALVLNDEADRRRYRV